MNKSPVSEWTFSYKGLDHKINLIIDTVSCVEPFPGSGAPIHKEYEQFCDLLSHIDNQKDPFMIELGCHWALASIVFRKIFPSGKNFVLEPDLGCLSVGLMNFDLNSINRQYCWGSIFPSDQSIDPVHHGFVSDPNPRGFQIDFIKDIYNQSPNGVIDVLHMDIQASEYPLIKQLDDFSLLDSSIKSLFIATHCVEQHYEILEILNKNNFTVLINLDRTILRENCWRKFPLWQEKEAAAFAKSVDSEFSQQDNFLIVYYPEKTDGLISAYKK